MFDQLIIGANRSYDYYEASVKERTIVDGKKKTIKETVPFSNKTYDFSKMDGELYWEEKTLQYTFEITANSAEELSHKVTDFKSWIMNVMEDKLYDPFITDYHFLATFSDISVDESEVEKATITVTFTAYPYMIANVPSTYDYDLTSGNEKKVVISNDSSHRITPTFVSEIPFFVKRGNSEFSIPSGETTDDNFKLDAGQTELVLRATQSGKVSITFQEEVF